MLKIGVIGFGYWGPNIVRNFTSIKTSQVNMICDINPKALKRAKESHPQISLTRNYKDIVNSSQIDAVAIVTPVSTHFKLAKAALENGKHIFIEKPFTASIKEAQHLVALARRKKLKIMVDHTFIFTGAVGKIKEVVEKGILGDLYYYDSTRVSLGLFQPDVNVIWDLAPHDFSIIDYVVKAKPVAVAAQGADHIGRGHENVAYITVHFANKMIAHINVNWLSPVKVRRTLIGGQKRMLVWDDLETDEKIKIYDKGVRAGTKDKIYRMLVDYRSGDMWSPHVNLTEALKGELQYFVDCVLKNKTPINDGEAGLRVVKMLVATDKSLKQGGKMIKL